jgi:cell filamentation protein
VAFDPFNDFETRGYLRNMFGEKDPDIIKHLEHSSFVAGISGAFKHLASIRSLSYRDVLHTHKILFGDVYPWAGQDRRETAPNIAVSKGRVLFAHPNDAEAAVTHGLRLGSVKSMMAAKPGEVMGYLAYGHPFLDGNGRTIMVVHAELAERAGISIEWTATNKAAYLDALTQEIERPGSGRLDAYLKPFLRQPVGVERLAEQVVNTRGLDGRTTEMVEENRVSGNVTDPELQARYEEQRLQRQREQECRDLPEAEE